MKDETAGFAIAEFVGLQSKMYLCLVDGNIEHKKAKSVNKNEINKIQSKDHKIKLMKSKIFLYPAVIIKFTSKIMDVMDYRLVIRVNYKKQLS